MHVARGQRVNSVVHSTLHRFSITIRPKNGNYQLRCIFHIPLHPLKVETDSTHSSVSVLRTTDKSSLFTYLHYLQEEGAMLCPSLKTESNPLQH